MPRVLPCAAWVLASIGLPIATAIHSTSQCGIALASLRRSSHLTTFAQSDHYNIVDFHQDVARDVGHIRFSSKSGFSVRELSLTRANSLWYIARLVPGMESLDTTLATSLRALVAHMPDDDAPLPLVLPGTPTDPAPVVRAQPPDHV
jgi:hypothetical protein